MCSGRLIGHSHLRFITRLRFFSIGGIGIAIAVVKLCAQPIPDPYGNHNRIINLKYEWALNVSSFLPIWFIHTCDLLRNYDSFLWGE